MKKLIKNFKLLSVLFIAISFIGCDDDEVVLPEVMAGFTYTVNQDSGTVSFINISENANTYEWDFGDGTSSKQINPIKSYETGEYTVVLKSKNVAGASGTFEDQVYINIPVPVRLPINFDGENVKYNTVGVFNGASFNVVENPDVSGSNSISSKVGAILNSGAAWEGFYYDLDSSINLSNNKTIKMNFWSNTVLDVLVKLEEGTAAATELSVSHGGTGWEEMIFTFDSSASYNRFTMFVDGPGATAGTFYIDDIEQVPTIDVTAPVITLNGNALLNVNIGDDFTDPGATAIDNIDGDISGNIVVAGDTVDINTAGSYIITYNVTDAAGNAAIEITRTVEVSAPPTAPKTSAPVPPTRDAANVISIYGETYTNIDIANYNPNWGQSGANDVNTDFDPGDGNLVLAYPNFNYQGTDFSAAQGASEMEFLHVDIWIASTVTDRMVKVSPINSGSGAGEFLVEVPVTPGAWNSVDLPKSAFTGMTWDAVTQMKFDGQFNADGSANTTPFDIYLDNIYFYKTAGTGGACSAENAESMSASNLNITFLTDQTANVIEDGGDFEWIDNPDSDNAVNNSCKVGKITKLGNNPWDNNQIDLDGKLDFNSNSGLKIKVWSALANTEVRIKLEEIGNAGNNVEQFLTTSVTNGWEELTFPFTSANSDKFDKIVIFFDLNANNTDTYYFDDLMLYGDGSTGGGGTGGGTGGCTGTLVSAASFPVNFEGCETFMDTTGGVKFGDVISAELAENPSKSGINTSDYVLKVDKPAGASHWEGVQNAFATDFDSSLTFKVKIYTTKANTRFVFEISNDPNDNAVGNPAGIEKFVVNANEWTEVEVTFPNVPAGGHNNFVIKPDDAGSGTVSVGAIHYFDDIRLE